MRTNFGGVRVPWSGHWSYTGKGGATTEQAGLVKLVQNPNAEEPFIRHRQPFAETHPPKEFLERIVADQRKKDAALLVSRLTSDQALWLGQEQPKKFKATCN